MPELDISIAGRSYRVACDPGEEAHLNAAARAIDIEAEALRKAAGSVPESRLMLMSALIIADRLNSTEARLRSAEETLRDSETALRSADAQLRSARERDAEPARPEPSRQEAARPDPVRPEARQPNLFAEDLSEDAFALLEETADRLEQLAGKVAPGG